MAMNCQTDRCSGRSNQCPNSSTWFRALSKGADLYAAVDLASDRIDAQLRKFKSKLRDHHRDISVHPLVTRDLNGPDEVQFTVVKQVPMTPISKETAVEEMDRMGYNFWMFRDKVSRQVNVIFRRVDDSYGLLRPAKNKR